MLKKIVVAISALAFVMLAVAMGPGVPTILAAVGTTTASADTKLSHLDDTRSCASFEVWFLDPACRQLQHARNVARTKQRPAARLGL